MKSCIAVDLGGTKMLVSEVLEDGTVCHVYRVATRDVSWAEKIEDIILAVRAYEAEYGFTDGKQPDCIGIGINGWVDPEKGLWLDYEQIHEFDVPVISRVEEAFPGIRCVIDNDVKCTVMAENIFGAGKGMRNMMYLNAGTGIAIGLIAGGKLVRGSDNWAGEVGFMKLWHPDLPYLQNPADTAENLKEPRLNELEMTSSGMAIPYQAKRLLHLYPDSLLKEPLEDGSLNGQTLLQAAEAGDALAGRILDALAAGLGNVITSCVTITSPEAVIIGGGLIQDEQMLKRIRSKVTDKALSHLEKGILLTGLDPNFAGLMGAAALGLGYQEIYR